MNFVVWLIKDFFGETFSDLFAVFRRPKSLFNVLVVLFAASLLLSFKYPFFNNIISGLGLLILIVYVWRKRIIYISETKYQERQKYKNEIQTKP